MAQSGWAEGMALLMTHHPINIPRWEISLLCLIARHRHDGLGRALFEEQNRCISTHARHLGDGILSDGLSARDRYASTVAVFIERSDARVAAVRLRQGLYS